MWIKKSELRVKEIYCLPNIISNVTNNKNDFQLITITPTIFFKNHNCNTFQSFQVFPSLPSFIFVVLFVHFFFLLKSYFFFHLVWLRFPFGLNQINFFAKQLLTRGKWSKNNRVVVKETWGFFLIKFRQRLLTAVT